jgi:hypothetical protein
MGAGGAERVVGRTPGAPSEAAAHDPRDSSAHDAVVHTLRIKEIGAYMVRAVLVDPWTPR